MNHFPETQQKFSAKAERVRHKGSAALSSFMEAVMERELLYVELKTGYSDDGPAWIGYVQRSKSGKTLYFNDHAFQKQTGPYSNYIDIENGDAYWISGVKRYETNRHWDGHGVIRIDKRAVGEFLQLIRENKLPHGYEPVDIEDKYPVERIRNMCN